MVSGRPRFSYDLGSGERDVILQYANASDGQWHSLEVSRYGNQVIMRMDGREGRYYVSSEYNFDEHSLIQLTGKRIVAAANVDYRYWEYLDRPNGIDNVLIDSKFLYTFFLEKYNFYTY